MPTLMSAIAQPAFTGITAQPIIASVMVSNGAVMNSNRLAPVGTTVSFISIFSASAKGLQQAKRAHHVRPQPHLHRRHHLAFGKRQVGDADQQRNQQQQCLDQSQHQHAEPGHPEPGGEVHHSAACCIGGCV